MRVESHMTGYALWHMSASNHNEIAMLLTAHIFAVGYSNVPVWTTTKQQQQQQQQQQQTNNF
jgi:hypothetical protein